MVGIKSVLSCVGSSMTCEGSSPALPARLGSYELIRPIAQGGMADIYLARHAVLRREVALKILNEERAGEAEARELFHHEARVCSLLSHRNIASVLDVDVAEGRHYLAMEYVDGVDLRELVGAAADATLVIPYEAAISI